MVKRSPAGAAMLALPLDACPGPRERGWCGKLAEAEHRYRVRHRRMSLDPGGVTLLPRTIAQILRLRPRT